jgi:hypothetical protein
MMQRRDLRVDLVELLLDAREIVRRVPGRRLGRCGRASRRDLRRTAVERALPRGNLLGPACRSALWRGLLRRGLSRRHGLELRRRCVARLLASEILRDLAPFGDHLIEPAVEPRQRIGDAILCAWIGGGGGGGGCAFVCRRCGRISRSRRRRARLREASLSHALQLSRQVVETLVNRSEVIFLVVHLIPICSTSVPHAFLRPLGWITQQPLNCPVDRRANTKGSAGAVLKPRANSCLSWLTDG